MLPFAELDYTPPVIRTYALDDLNLLLFASIFLC